MAFDKVTFRSELPAVVRKELDRDFARSRRWSKEEHHADGTHGDVTADSLTISGHPPSLAFIDQDATGRTSVGTITTDDGAIVIEIDDVSGYLIARTAIGDILIGKRPGTTGGAAALYAGIVFDAADLGGTIQYGFGASTSGLSPGRDAFALYDVTNDQPILKFWRNAFALGTNTYLIAPDGDHAAVADVYLGYRSDAEQRFREVAGDLIYGHEGIQERSRTVSMGDWTTFFGTFSGNGSMTWTSVTETAMAYTLIGTTMTVSFHCNGTVGGTPNSLLRILIPASKTSTKYMNNAVTISDATNGLHATIAQVVASGTQIMLYNIVAGAAIVWPAGAMSLFGQITFEVDP